MSQQSSFEIIRDSLKSHARKVGSKPKFWDVMTENILTGKIEGLDPEKYVRIPKDPGIIAQAMFEHLHNERSWEDASPDEKVYYYEIIKIVRFGLGFGPLDL